MNNTNCRRNTFAKDIPEKKCVRLPFIPSQVTQNSLIPFGRIILWTLVSDVYVDRSHSCIAPSLFVLFIPCLRQVRRQCYVFTNFSMFDPCPLMQTQPSTAQATFREHDLHHKHSRLSFSCSRQLNGGLREENLVFSLCYSSFLLCFDDALPPTSPWPGRI